MARAAVLLVLALAVLAAPAGTHGFQCPTLALQVAPLQAACADATTVCTACVAAIAKQLEPAFQTALAQGVAMLSASMVRCASSRMRHARIHVVERRCTHQEGEVAEKDDQQRL